MPNSTSLLAFPDCKKALDQALASERGVRLEFPSSKDAFRFMGRCNSFRLLDRKENAKIYTEPAHTLHGRSIYDVLKIVQENQFIIITKVGSAIIITEL